MTTFTNDQHRQHCEEAGCKHPAVHFEQENGGSQGWCFLCRTIAFGIEAAQRVEDAWAARRGNRS